MNNQTIWVPFSVLNGTAESAHTRLIWLLLQHHLAGNPSAPTTSRLRQLSGLDAKTIAAARARLLQAPLAPCHIRPHPACSAIPLALLMTAEISPRARLLYGQLQGLPSFQHPCGSFTYAALSRFTGSSDDALRGAVGELVATKWLTITQAKRKHPLCFTLRSPVSTTMRARISSLRRRVKSAKHKGETILREFLDVLVALDDYKENAAPDFLLNPYTGELMEFDRYYPTVGIAIEFNGAQHYEETDLATFEATVKQIGRDAMKAFICKTEGIELVVIQPEELKLKILDQKIPGRLPRRNLEGMGPLVATLEDLALEYRERSADERGRKNKSVKKGKAGLSS